MPKYLVSIDIFTMTIETNGTEEDALDLAKRRISFDVGQVDDNWRCDVTLLPKEDAVSRTN